MQTLPTSPTPRERASALINQFATKTAALEAATAETRAQIVSQTAALNQASAPYLMDLAQLEDQAKSLALEYGPAIFGQDRRSLTENGYVLGLRETTAVVVENEKDAVRMIQQDLQQAEFTSNDEALVMGYKSLLRINVELDREYIDRHFDAHSDFFLQYGISVASRQSASLKKAPPPRPAKAKTKPSPKLKTTAVEEQEAA